MLHVITAVGLVMLALVVLAIAAFAFLTWRFLWTVEHRPETMYDPDKLAPDGESLCASCLHMPEFPDCPGEEAGEAFTAEEGPLYCDGYERAS